MEIFSDQGEKESGAEAATDSLQPCSWTLTPQNPFHNNHTPVRDFQSSVASRMAGFLLFPKSNVPFHRVDISAVYCLLIELRLL